MKQGNERKSSSSSPLLDCDVVLGLKMQTQPTEPYSYDGDGGGVPFFSNKNNRAGSLSDIYEAADRVVLARGFRNIAFRASGGGMAVSGKALFTASQWQELERQKMIHKYIMASIPVPPQLLLPTSRSPPPLASASQSNTSGLDLRYPSSGSDPEPWRCKRTDGKKWRCSRDVAPDQKYCERHAHKTRPRSRKHVEISSHNNCSQRPLIRLTSTTPPPPPPLQPLQGPTPQFPTMASTTSYDQTRCIEWFMRGGSSSVSTCNQEQWQQLMQIPSSSSSSSSSSSRLELNRDNTQHHKNVSVLYQPHYEDHKQGFITLNPYIPDTNHHQLGNSILDSKMTSLQEGLSQNAERTQTTRHFIDAWEKEGLSESLSKKFSPSSLSLSMSAENNENGDYLGIRMMNSDRESSDGILKPPQWVNLNPVSWINSPPGGPLGEALCLGNANTTTATTTRGGYSNSNTNSSSSCSKSSCEDGSHALNFIG